MVDAVVMEVREELSKKPIPGGNKEVSGTEN
jgi:hypothetical protein